MSIDNTDDIIDSRDIIDRIEELRQHLGLDEDEYDENGVNTKNTFNTDPEKTDLLEELKTLEALAKEAEPESSDWDYGESLIRRSYFVEYVQDMLADCGTIPKDIPWFVEIDWEATAKNIESDYASVDFDGVEYLIRSC